MNMNNYLLEGVDSLAIDVERNKIIKKNKFQDVSINIYDLE